jgi:hypothetical protein
MACSICGRSSCAKYMHSLEEQQAHDEFEGKTERQMIDEIISLRQEVKELKEEKNKE